MVKTYTLNHFGIVASTCKELKIAEIIDELIPPNPQQILTAGQAVVSMIINGLGFSNRRLYLFPQFFENKPVKLLVAYSVSAEHLNDDTIGRTLDRVFDYGCTELFCYVAHKATDQEHVNRKYGHLDSTTFSLHGEYSSDDDGRVAIKIVRGHPKSKRPDLNQIFLNLMVSDDGGVPLFMQTLDGNSSDSVTFRNNISAFKNGLKKNFQELTYYIADCKFYTAETLKITRSDLLWISRVPDNIKDAKDVIADTGLALAKSIDRLKPLNNEGYSYRQYSSSFADVKHRSSQRP